jgi:alpha-D-xyloside xylohydrolase
LIVRWFQFGVFCPVFRLHGIRQPGTMIGAQQTGADNEVWSFGDEQYEIISRLLFLRERLRPYVQDQMRATHETGVPPMRPLFVDHPDDPTSWEVEDQYLFGPDVLVAPVYIEGARERRVWLPPGTTWVNAWSRTEHEGGQWVDAPAPLDTIPVYVRQGGAVAPFGPLADLEPAGE